MSLKPPPDLWVRMASLNDCCDVTISSAYLEDEGGAVRLWWDVRIVPRDAAAGVRTRDRSLLKAVVEAVEQVHARGWVTPAV